MKMLIRIIVFTALLGARVSGAEEGCAQYLESKNPAATLTKLRADKSAESQFCVAAFYYRGIGVKQDVPESVRWLRQSAAQGYPPALMNLGAAYRNGEGVLPDKAEAVRLFHQAAEKQFPKAEFALGSLHYLGEGAEKNAIEAAKWWKKAADHGQPDAKDALRKLGASFVYDDQAGDYEAMLVLLDKDGRPYPTSTGEAGAPRKPLSAQVGDEIYVMVHARNCRRDKDGSCAESVRIGIFGPDWRLDNEFEGPKFDHVPDVHIWPQSTGTDSSSFKLRVADRDAPGPWHVFAVVYDGATPKLNLDQVYRVKDRQ